MRFSIIIPTYNAEKFITRGVKSVLKQTFDDFELIVVDDGSKDRTLERLKSINDERLVVISQANKGVSIARNTGISNAHGEFVCFLDADDEYLPNHLEHLAGLITENPSKEFFATRFCVSLRTDSNNIIMPATTGDVKYYEDAVQEMLRNTEMIWTGCVCIKREMFEKYGMFEPGVKLGEDTDMWKRVYVHSGIVYSDTVTVQRNRDGSEATKYYARSYVADPLNRMPMFLSDDTILDNIKESLKTEYELTKLQVVRSYLVDGKKKEAKQRISQVDKNRISKKRLMVTYFCFCIPSAIIRLCLNIKNRGMYEGGYTCQK
ncbi:glycosyltransferase family 2 protein [Neobacillus drentensis]|uniref:glycosyltransferase family 2 protein n=1 Tax=Neobacillus drentensis TaxID=220684 RepID=UPI003000DC5B